MTPQRMPALILLLNCINLVFYGFPYLIGKDVFELYYLLDDFREESDLSEIYPDKLNELKSELLKACDGNLINGLYSSRKNQIKIE